MVECRAMSLTELRSLTALLCWTVYSQTQTHIDTYIAVHTYSVRLILCCCYTTHFRSDSRHCNHNSNLYLIPCPYSSDQNHSLAASLAGIPPQVVRALSHTTHPIVDRKLDISWPIRIKWIQHTVLLLFSNAKYIRCIFNR